ncbi:MAG: trypsin-like peptidase domain-containing protein, partial [Oscillospiraceae bacterium]|nr:trypsin-like peptidase domain-containing protein [Oscillospiraceae bacterium]
MDNNFDENIAADSNNSENPNSGDPIGEEKSADTEQHTLQDLQNSVTDSSAGIQLNHNGSYGTPAADEWSAQASHTAQNTQSAQQTQNILGAAYPFQNAAPNPYSPQTVPNGSNIQQGQSGQFGQQQYPQGQQMQQGGTPHFTQNFGDTGAPQYVPPQGQVQGSYPPPMPPQSAPAKKRFSGGCFWSLVSAVVLMFAAVVVLAVKIAAGASDELPNNGSESKFDNLAETQKAEHVIIDLPTADKPQLDDELYADKESGLLTSIGVAKTILPSQVQIKVFDDIPYAPISSGSGIILTEDGYILTNAHVVDGAKKLSVGFYGDGESEAVIVGIDKKSDLAVIKVNKTGLTPAQIGTSSTLEIGEEVALAGAGGGFENTVTYGHVTGLGREIDTDYISSSTINCIQSDAALNPGNSGGALVNMYGQVVGVAVALMNHETYENIGFCIAIDDAVPIAEDLIANGYVSTRTRVGITYVSIGDAAANGYGIPAGLCVMEIDPRSGAIYAGLKPYDVITHIDGQRVFGASEISEVLADKIPGDVITISVFRKEVTGETDFFDAEIELVADTSSFSGYNVT